MLRENVEILLKTIGAFDERNKEAWLLWHDPEIEFRADPNWPESETIRGPDAVWDFLMKAMDAMDFEDLDLLEFIGSGDDKLAGRIRRPVRGKASGVSDVLDYWCVCTFRRGRVFRMTWFVEREKALEAARLPD